MEHLWLYTLGSVFLVSLVSLIGVGALAINKQLLHRLLLVIVSFAAGGLLGDVFFHLLPELVEDSGLTLPLSLSILFGMILFFLFEKFICWHHCHTGDHCDGEHPHQPHHKGHQKVHRFGHTILLGDLLHNFIDGILIAASYLVSIPVGIATTVAVIFHEIPQEIGDFGVLVKAGHTNKKALLLNFASALTSLIGAAVGLVLGTFLEKTLPILIGITAGSFIYIATADLIPELHKEIRIKHSLLQLFGFIFGIVTMYGLLFLE